MSCATCDATIHGVGYGMFHCPRCGTFRSADGMTTTPALVARCREFETELGPFWGKLWHKTGIAEAIHQPERR